MNSTTIIIMLVLIALIILYNVKKPKNYEEKLSNTEGKSEGLMGDSGNEASHKEEEIIGAIMGALSIHRELEGKDFIITGIRRVSKKESNWRKAGLK